MSYLKGTQYVCLFFIKLGRESVNFLSDKKISNILIMETRISFFTNHCVFSNVQVRRLLKVSYVTLNIIEKIILQMLNLTIAIR